jgi:hypothetical protein
VKRLLISAIAAAGLFGVATPNSVAATGPVQLSSDPAVQWNAFLLGLQATPGDQPATVHPTYDLAVMHTALNNAVQSAQTRVQFRASPAAAADAAAHDTLVSLYPPLRPAIAQQYATLINRVPDGARRAAGIRVGQRAARAVLADRARDGSGAAPTPFTPGTAPGDYQLTPPALAAPVFTNWGRVRPFVLRRGFTFRPPAPPPLTSPQYAAAINEVRTLGIAGGSTRTPDQTQIGLFWNPPIWATWNQIAQTVISARHGTLSDDAQTFAALDLTLADSVIGLYDAKYTYHLWRPITAIRAADTDGNPATAGDPTWTPLSNTAPDPSYPGAHATVSAAAASVLASRYGDGTSFAVTSTALPGVQRSFTSFSAAAGEASMSRIYNGNHTRLDEDAGRQVGRNVARFVLRNAAPLGLVPQQQQQRVRGQQRKHR